MLRVETVSEAEGVAVLDAVCTCGHGQTTEAEHSTFHAVVFVRRGSFRRTVDGSEDVLDPTVAYCMAPGQEQQFDHPVGGGDTCTAVVLAPELTAALWGGDPALPAGVLGTAPGLDVAHRVLLARARTGEPDLAEDALLLCAGALERVDAARVASGRPSGASARAALADAAREALAVAPDRSLTDLARELAVSPHHLSRIFRQHTGSTVKRYRLRLRARAALERLMGGEGNLARLAADAGFSDQSHLCRALRDETGTTPAVLRGLLSGG